MKNTKHCPKCLGEDIVRIEGNWDTYGVGNNVRTGIFSIALVTKYVCLGCGFSEEWVESKEDLEKIRKKYKTKE